MSESTQGERLQKVLANAGLGSRREIETLIREGKVTVNGQPVELGVRILGGEHITLNGRPISIKRTEAPQTRVLIYYKPEGELTTKSDPEGRPTIFKKLPRVEHARWIAVGRLDINTSGLILLTTDGNLAHQLMHPSSEIEREYAVRVLGEVKPEILQKLRDGVTLDDGPAHFERVEETGGTGANRWYHVVLKEGRNREVRRLWESQGLTVSRLMRVRYGPIRLPPRLGRGHFQELTPREIAELMTLVGMDVPESLSLTEKKAGQGREPAAARERTSQADKPQHNTAQRSTPERGTQQRSTPQRSTPQRSKPAEKGRGGTERKPLRNTRQESVHAPKRPSGGRKKR